MYLLEESDFGMKVPRDAARRTRVLVAIEHGNVDSCSFIRQVGQLDRECIDDWRYLMLDLCRKARSGMPLAALFGTNWREVDTWQICTVSGVMSVSTFLLTRGCIALLGLVVESGHVLVISTCKNRRGIPNQADLARCRRDADGFCHAIQRNVLQYLPRSMS
ncbi:MAG: hypothetical protein EOP10_25530 [Proteobacteria bacterium]|nr:MAG: hypothetical protein EOP10_25530 [Pseudomonadota bacterium]